MNSIVFFDWGYNNKGVILKINNLSVDLGDISYLKLYIRKVINGDGQIFPCTFSIDGEEGLKLKIIGQNTYKFSIDDNADDFFKQLYNELLVGGFFGFEVGKQESVKSNIIENRWLRGYSMIEGQTDVLKVTKISNLVTDDINQNTINLNFEQLPNVFPHRQVDNINGYTIMQNNINQRYIWDFKFCDQMEIYFFDSGFESVDVTTIQLGNFYTVFNFNLTAVEMHKWLRYYDKHIKYIKFSSGEIINSGQIVDKNSIDSSINDISLDSSLIQYHLDTEYITFNFTKQTERTKLSNWMLDNYFQLYVSDF